MNANRLTGTQLTDEQKRRQRGKNIAVIFDNLLGLFCVEYVILVVVIDLRLVVGLLCGHCDRCCDYSTEKKGMRAVCCDCSDFMLWRLLRNAAKLPSHARQLF